VYGNILTADAGAYLAPRRISVRALSYINSSVLSAVFYSKRQKAIYEAYNRAINYKAFMCDLRATHPSSEDDTKASGHWLFGYGYPDCGYSSTVIWLR
jgi:hypothetical protein